MTELTKYEFVKHDGLPPSGERGAFFGFDAAGNAYILRWHERHPAAGAAGWVGVGFDPKHERDMPFAFNLNGDMAGFIVAWAGAPLPWADVDAAISAAA